MTIDEAIKDIKENIQPSVGGLSLEMAIQALEEIEEYRVKEFQCHLAQQEGISIGYHKAIDEFAEALRHKALHQKNLADTRYGIVSWGEIIRIAEQMKGE